MTEPRIERPEETASSDTYRWLSKCSAHKESIREREREKEREREREREKERERDEDMECNIFTPSEVRKHDMKLRF